MTLDPTNLTLESVKPIMAPKKKWIPPSQKSEVPHSIRIKKELATAKEITRFWSKVRIGDDSECWEWGRYRQANGYGTCRFQKLQTYAHVVAFVLSHGTPPNGKTQVLHSCDNPACCNPNHLSAGSQVDNMKDMDSRGRRNHGKKAKLSQDAVRLIRERLMLDPRCSYRMAAELGVHPQTIYNVRDGNTWRGIK